MISYSRQIGLLSSSAQSIAATTTISFQAEIFFIHMLLNIFENLSNFFLQIIIMYFITSYKEKKLHASILTHFSTLVKFKNAIKYIVYGIVYSFFLNSILNSQQKTYKECRLPELSKSARIYNKSHTNCCKTQLANSWCCHKHSF